MSPVAALLIEAFASGPLQGNGAAVVHLTQPAAASWMQALAASLKQSETAFLWRSSQGEWLLRWFTPSCEVALCGHATLAATLALRHWQWLLPGATASLATRSGPLQVRVDRDHQAALVLPGGGLVPSAAPVWLETLLAAPPLAYWHSALGYRVALLDQAVALADLPCLASELQGAERDGLVLMQAWNPAATTPTAPSGGNTLPQVFGEPPDYQLRFFAPGLGIDEDPVTGSAHALVAPWWMQQLGRSSVVGWQASPRRGGMRCETAGEGRVRLVGTGHLLWEGPIHAGSPGSDLEGWEVCRRC